jgi:S-formylglutathione hydrolase FrmB
VRSLIAALVAIVALAMAAPAGAAEDPALVGSQQVTPRLQELTLRTPELAGDTHIRVLLPEGYNAKARRRYPVLYLLHGASDDYRSWSDKAHVEKVVGPLPLIVVMPDGGRGGFYSDWYNDGAGGPPQYETFHVRRLIPWIDSHYRTIAARRGRAVAGLSMGGFGTMSYAARHPDLFSAAAAFSGAVDTNTQGGIAVISAAPFLNDTPQGSVFGPRATQEVRWRGSDPVDLADNLRGLQLTIRTGNGQPGGPFGGGPDAVEAGVHEMSVNLHNRLDELGLPHVWEDYGPGAHDWPYWERDLTRTLPDLMHTFAARPKPPSPFTFTATEPRYSVYGWSVAIDRPALEFSRLEQVDKRGFTLAGSGDGTVTTARLYKPRVRYVVRVGTTARRVRASRSRRLRISVPLGPGNTSQQLTPGADTQVFRTRVRIHRDG